MTLPKMSDVSIRQTEYTTRSANKLGMDIYYPPNSSPSSSRLPVVTLVTGHKDSAIEAAVGCKLKDTEQYQSWSKLLAASGLIAITYVNQEPEDDVFSVFEFLADNDKSLGIDLENLGVWSCSANVPNALAFVMSKRIGIRCAAFFYGYMLDGEDNSVVSDAASKSGFAAPISDKSIDDLPSELALRVVRAGADRFPGINQTIDDFCADALARNLAITLVNHPNAPHSFDILDDTFQTKAIIRDTLEFFSDQLTAGR